MVTVSLCMIVKNEEEVLSRCLSSIKELVDEIVIVDTGSTDKTKDIAAEFTDKVYDFEWIDDFSAARNFAYGKAECDYIMWLDADDVILPEDAAKFKKLKDEMDPDTDAVMLPYNSGFDDKGRVVFSYFRERLSKRSRGFSWQEPVHEYLQVFGKVISAEPCVTHRKIRERPGKRNLTIYESLLSQGKPLSPRGTYYYARELKDNGRYSDAAARFESFLDSELGWVEDNITACGELSKCYGALGEGEKALSCLWRSFGYDVPRAEIICLIGYHFKEKQNYPLAAFWFELILKLRRPQRSMGFFQEDCWGYIPCLECAVCYDKMGDGERGEMYNEMAAVFKPDSPSVAHNRRYFSRKISENSEKAE